MRSWIEKHSLILWVVAASLILQYIYVWLGWYDWSSDQRQHGQQPTMLGWQGWVVKSTAEWCVNASAEGFGAYLIVFGTKHFREKGSKESKPTAEEKGGEDG